MPNHFNQVRIGSLTTAVLLILALGAIPVASATMTGLVTDQTDGQPLLGATITARPTNPALEVIGTATAEDGAYELDLPPGKYTVSISFVGYTTVTLAVANNEPEGISVETSLVPKAIDLNTISVTTSRRPEKVNDAPASVSVVEAEAIAERTALTVTDHVKGLPAVDMARTGLNQTNMVTRGFNNIFSGALLVLTDNRMARVPSLRFNAYNFIPTVSNDIERIEIVSGPGSALYGPNSAAGVMHIVTKSPFGSEGTTVSVGGGERDLMMGSFRHAGNVNNRIGYKITGQYYEGNDWEHTEPSEPTTVYKYRPTADGADTISVAPVDNARDYNTKKLSGEARVDFLINENTSFILNGGYNRGTGIELTGLSAAQAIDWVYSYGQARLMYKDLFIQGFVNTSDAGDTYLLNTGQLIVDKSRVWSAQLQHSYRANDKWLFTYGADAIMTRPNTDATINGRNEDDDNIDEIGAYLQLENQLSEKLKFVGAARVDNHSRLEKLNFSPRAALVFHPNNRSSLRFTYNRAFATPDNNNLFLDILQLANPFHTGINVRVQGVPETGFHWQYDGNGDPMFRTQFSPYVGNDATHYYSQGYLSQNLTNVAWGAGVQLTRGSVIQGLMAQGVDAGSAIAIGDAVASVAPTSIDSVETIVRVLDLDTGAPIEVNASDYIQDIDRLKPAITQTFELGYKGMIGNRFRFSVDGYRTNKHNFVGPLSVETPNVFMDIDASLAAEIGPVVGFNYATADPATQAMLDQLDANGNGPVDELVTMYITGGASTALGTFTPEEALNPNDVMITYRNFGDITYYGIDFSFAYHLNRSWDFGGSYSYISQNFFNKDEDENLVHDIRLNAPRNKVGLYVQYNQPVRHLSMGLRGRYVDAFDMDSPFFGSRIESYIVADLNAGVDILSDLRFTLTVQNVFNNEHVEFIGAPALGRLATARLTQTF